jgi:hypothetical protein
LFGIWLVKGRPVPPPEIEKYRTVRSWQRRFRCGTFIETGTYLGDMIDAVRHEFPVVISIELDERLAAEARLRFANVDKVRVLPGDSSQLLPIVLREINTRCLFWLDAHYSGGITARGAADTPVHTELEAIFDHAVKDHIVLIDDARLFDGTRGYPRLAEVRERVRETDSYELDVVSDIICISPRRGGNEPD